MYSVRKMLLSKSLLLEINKSSKCLKNLIKYSTTSNVFNKHNDHSPPPEWIPIYKCKLIKTIASFNKLKIYQSMITAAGVPITMGLEMTNQLPAGSAEIFAALGEFTFFTYGLFFFYQSLNQIIFF